MKRLVLALAGAMMLSGAAFANDTMDSMIGKSVVYTYPDGTAVTATYASDGTYTTASGGSGSWTMDGDELCITTSDGQSGCTTLAAGHSSGDSWDATDAFGNPVNIKID